MATSRPVLLAGCLFATCAAPTFAQQAGAEAKPDRIVLEAQVGSVMASTGGDYASVAPGTQLASGESLMLTAGAKATVVYYYDNGDRKCVERYAGPNTYVIDDSCVQAAGTMHGNNLAATGIIVGAGVIGAAILESMDESPVPPLSAGAR